MAEEPLDLLRSLRPAQIDLVQRQWEQLRSATLWQGGLPVLLLDRCWLRLEVVPVDGLLQRLPPDASAEAPELVRYRELCAGGLDPWVAQLQCWEEFGAPACQQALRLHWWQQDRGPAGWTLATYLNLRRRYRQGLLVGDPRLPLLVLPRRDSGEPHRLLWLQPPFAIARRSMRHTCA
ncbi:MAG: hypothetical protein ACKO5F_04480 [Synechococcus sp.]